MADEEVGQTLKQADLDRLQAALDYIRASRRRGSLPSAPSRVRPQEIDPVACLVKITATASGGGKYEGKILDSAVASVAATGTLAEATDVGTFPSAVNALILNLSEVGSSSHALESTGLPVVFIGVNLGFSSQGLQVVAINGVQGTTFAVTVEKDGGSNGTASTAATYTYTVRTLNGATLGTTVTQSRPRPYGTVTYQVGSSGYGLAFYVGATLKLWDAGEYPGSGGC